MHFSSTSNVVCFIVALACIRSDGTRMVPSSAIESKFRIERPHTDLSVVRYRCATSCCFLKYLLMSKRNSIRSFGINRHQLDITHRHPIYVVHKSQTKTKTKRNKLIDSLWFGNSSPLFFLCVPQMSSLCLVSPHFPNAHHRSQLTQLRLNWFYRCIPARR